jgi:hypothetical protein
LENIKLREEAKKRLENSLALDKKLKEQRGGGYLQNMPADSAH